ncbi:hypothetical protein [Bradyrhizobium sp. WD16]|uniref:hypothetical protein n=1 Tax=Bradyrhizobium sp. WD16 TaxID=1521768 RepID=UPI0020A3E8D5|nr:hypothetical protein [Bradyrhizobium sp. WD16]UTD28639.1 hypothetical protein DB459_18775 [Bradyrhizobium sp. WD16]
MRKWMTGIAAAAVLTTAGVAPAVACGWDVSPCSGGLLTGYAVAPAGPWAWDRVPDPQGPRYYYVNQGPYYSGPAAFAPVPTYQERAVSGWPNYERGFYYGYNGGPYGDAMTHYYDGMPAVRGPMVYRYAPRVQGYGPGIYRYRHSSLRYGDRTHRAVRYGYAPRRLPHHSHD